MSKGHKEKRAPYEFSPEVKLDALKRAHWRCERCGKHKSETPEGYLEIHHILAIGIVIKDYPQLAPAIVKSLANAKVLCCDCHTQIHREETQIANASQYWKLSQLKTLRV